MMKNEFETVELKSYKSEMEGDMVAKLLSSHGIFTMLKNDDPAGMGFERGEKVIVRKIDKDKALEILNTLSSEIPD